MTLKLSRADALRPMAEDAVDRHFAKCIDEVLGPMAALHAIKRMRAQTGGALGKDAREIMARAAEQDEQLAALDDERRAMKADIRAASTAAEIKAILARIV